MSDSRPMLIYEGGCGFCEYTVRYWQRLTGNAVEYRPYQEVADRFPDLNLADFKHSIRYMATDGAILAGAHAAYATLAHVRGRGFWLSLYRSLPWFAGLAEVAYQFVAHHRPVFHRISVLLWGRERRPAEYGRISWLFLRLLGLIYLAAFVSFAVQAQGLIGAHGILPIAEHLNWLAESADARRFWFVPTIFWIDASDLSVTLVPWLGAACSLVLFFDKFTRTNLVILYLLYLSLYHAGQIFMGYQWDILLLEVGFLAILLPFWTRLSVWLLRWLTFRFILLSGAVKLLSGDPAWANWTALNFHYETQPLPTTLAWFAHQLPEWFQRISAGTMFAIELILPFFLFLPRRPRMLAAWFFIGLELLIMMTGNYNFFNLLTIVLCLTLFDDQALAPMHRLIRAVTSRTIYSHRPAKPATKSVLIAIASLLIAISAGQMWHRFTARTPPAAALQVMRWIEPLQAVNAYGLFAVMTTTRNEIIVEGSRDGRHWEAYEFRYKPGDPARRPGWLIPHQPRLDWQMWFAALGTRSQNPWFGRFMERLLAGSEPVTGLLEHNPFGDTPPKLVRARFFRYEFTDADTRTASGHWWTRQYSGIYFPPSSGRY